MSRFRNGSTRRWRQLRQAVISRATHCGLCGQPFLPHDYLPGRIHVDHVTPLAAGGAAHDPRNLQAVHSGCNLAKGAKTQQDAPAREPPAPSVFVA